MALCTVEIEEKFISKCCKSGKRKSNKWQKNQKNRKIRRMKLDQVPITKQDWT